MGAKAKTLQDYKDLEKTTGIRFLGDAKPNSTHDKVNWLCVCGRVWVTTYDNVKRGRKCKECGISKQSESSRNTIDDYRALAEFRGFTLDQDTVSTTKDKVWWKCPKGHRWRDAFTHIQEGRGCPDCKAEETGRKKPNRNLTANDFREAGQRHGFEWASNEVVRASDITTWKCQFNHEWLARYSTISGGVSGCPYCSGKARKTRADYETLAALRGFVFVGPEVPNTGTLTGWKCSNPDHPIWMTDYDNVKAGKSCPHCSGVARRTLEDYLELAKKKAITLVNHSIPNGTGIKTKWRCPEGHIWSATYQTIASSPRNGCLKCYRASVAETRRIKPEGYHTLASELGYTWLGPEVEKTKHLTKWLCGKGHKISATYDGLQAGQRCNQCSQSAGEQEVSRVLRKLGVDFETEKRFKECKDKHTLPFDFYFEIGGVRVLCEYDGQYHTQASRHYPPEQARQKLKETQKRDAIKDRFAQENGFVLIRIAYTRFKEIEAILAEEIGKYREGNYFSLPIYAQYRQLSFA